MTHSKAVLLFHEKVEYVDGDVVEVKAWSVTPSPTKPEGIKYSLVYIGADGTRILGYQEVVAGRRGANRERRPKGRPSFR